MTSPRWPLRSPSCDGTRSGARSSPRVGFEGARRHFGVAAAADALEDLLTGRAGS